MAKQDAICDEIVLKLSQKMRDIREEKNISKNELSQRSGISRAAIRRIEEGQRSPSLYILLMLCRSMEVSLWELLKEVEKWVYNIFTINNEQSWIGQNLAEHCVT